jgi:hypothetical protein
MQHKLHYFIAFFLVYSLTAKAQSVYAPIDYDYYHLIDRLDIKGGTSGDIYTNIKPYFRKDIAKLADSLSKDSARFSKVDKKDIQYLRDDNWEWSNVKDSGKSNKPFIWGLYKKKNDFYEATTKGFQCQVNPVLYLSYGSEMDSSKKKTTFINTRGVEVRGSIDDKIGFYTFLTDNQAYFPQYVNNRVKATSVVPGEGYWQTYKTGGYDFYDFNGYVDFHLTRHITTQFGQDKNFIGDGYRSLMLSDYSPSYLFWKIDTKIWKFDYINVWAKMTADVVGTIGNVQGDVFYPQKYMALHYLSFNVSKNFNIGLFECITFGNTDTIHNRGYDFTYLNPIIFYKAAENGLGAPDKDHIGITWKWNFLHHFSLYGTFFIDEFNLDEIKDSSGWWGDKQALQMGLKYIDVFGIKNLDLQYEFNVVRPYTYTHFSFSKTTDYSYYANYSNYDQPLADPNGANFYENIVVLRFQPTYKLSFTAKAFYTAIGLDSAKSDYGSNIMIDYNKHPDNYNNVITQGYFTTITYLSFTATYQLKHNMFIDLSLTDRKEISDDKAYNSDDKIVQFSFRWNVGQRLQEF